MIINAPFKGWNNNSIAIRADIYSPDWEPPPYRVTLERGQCGHEIQLADFASATCERGANAHRGGGHCATWPSTSQEFGSGLWDLAMEWRPVAVEDA